MQGLLGTRARQHSTDYCIQRRDTSNQVCAADTTAGLSVSHKLDPAYQISEQNVTRDHFF